MSAETQKLELISWIAGMEDPKAVKKVYEQVKKLLRHADMLDDLPPEALAELEAADAETDPGDTISHEEAETDWWATLSDKEQIHVQQALQELDKGERMTHEAVRADINQMLGK